MKIPKIHFISVADYCFIWAVMREKLTLLHVNNKGTDQPAHPCSQISTFVFPFLQTMIYKLCFVYNNNILASLLV